MSETTFNKLQIVLLGTGGPGVFLRRHGPATLIRWGDQNVLFDAGRGVVRQMVRAGLRAGNVNPLFITHHHFDHIIDLGDVILSSWLFARRQLQVVGPRGTRDMVSALVERVYARDIRFRTEGEPTVVIPWQDVQVREIDSAGLAFEGSDWRVYAEEVEHGQGLGIPDFDWLPLGYRFEAGGKAVAISGDCVPCAGVDRLALGADVLVHCCLLTDSEIKTPEGERLRQFILATSAQVGKVAARAGVRKLVLTHIRDKPDDLLHEMAADARRDFDGEVIIGEDLMEIEV